MSAAWATDVVLSSPVLRGAEPREARHLRIEDDIPPVELCSVM